MTEEINYTHKHCNCPKNYWEIIIVDFDENFENKSTIYHHCDLCGIDWLITNYFDDSIIYHKEYR